MCVCACVYCDPLSLNPNKASQAVYSLDRGNVRFRNTDIDSEM